MLMPIFRAPHRCVFGPGGMCGDECGEGGKGDEQKPRYTLSTHREKEVTSFDLETLAECYVQPHRERIVGLVAPLLPLLGAAIQCSAETHHCLVHQQLSPKEWKRIDKATAAVDK